MKHRDTTDPIAWARRINRVWKVRNGLGRTATEWLDYLEQMAPERLRRSCANAAALSRGPGYGSDPKPWFYAGLFSLATPDEARRYLSNHRFTLAVIPVFAHDPETELWVATLSETTRALIARVRRATAQEVANQITRPAP